MKQNYQEPNSAGPLAILIRGLPGSGKTYLSDRLAKTIGLDKVVLLDPDKIDFNSEAYNRHVKESTAEGVDPVLFPYRFLRAQAYRGIEMDKIVIWNQPFSNEEIFRKLTARLNEHAKSNSKALRILVVEETISPEAASHRVSKRLRAGGHGPSEVRFNRFVEELHSLAGSDFSVVKVSGEAAPSQSISAILSKLNEPT